LHSDRLKCKGYEKQLSALEQVAIELSCHPDEKVSIMSCDVDKKVASMAELMKSYKKFAFKVEAELKKDWHNIA
jgi:hypothetical protein